MPEETEYEHIYHAEAHVLSGNLLLPVKQEIQPQAYAKLPKEGGYLAQQSEEFRLESVITYKAAHTQVAGHMEGKGTGGFRTLVTSVIEGLNVLNVVTADRIVGQISTLHMIGKRVPRVTFLGTQFVNLKISGVPVTGLDNARLDLDLDLFAKHAFEEGGHMHDPWFHEKVSQQHERLQQDPELSEEESAAYTPRKYNLGEAGDGYTETVECSLVNHVRGSFPGTSFGHLVRIPHFGAIKLANVKLEQSDYVNGVPQTTLFNLVMVDMKLGCVGTGQIGAGTTIVNGGGPPKSGGR